MCFEGVGSHEVSLNNWSQLGVSVSVLCYRIALCDITSRFAEAVPVFQTQCYC